MMGSVQRIKRLIFPVGPIRATQIITTYTDLPLRIDLISGDYRPKKSGNIPSAFRLAELIIERTAYRPVARRIDQVRSLRLQVFCIRVLFLGITAFHP